MSIDNLSINKPIEGVDNNPIQIDVNNINKLFEDAKITGVGEENLGVNPKDYNFQLKGNGYDNNELRAQLQPTSEKWKNGLMKFGGTALESLSGVVSLPVGIGAAILDGNVSKIYDNPVSNAFKTLNEEIDKVTPIYSTHKQEDSPLYSPNYWFTSTFGAKLLGNLGFTAGAILGGVGVAKLMGNLGKLAVGADKIAELGEVTEKLYKTGKFATKELAFAEAINTVGSSINNINTATKFTATGVAAMSEATVEALGIKDNLNNSLKEQFMLENNREPNEVELKNIQNQAEAGANVGFALNTAVLAVSDNLQFGNLFKGYTNGSKTLKGIASQARVNKVGNEYIANLIKYPKLNKVGKFLLGDNLKEATEEQLQFAIEKGTENYFKNKDKAKSDFNNLFESTAKGLEEAYGTREGLENGFIGYITGGITHTFGSVKNKIQGVKPIDLNQVSEDTANHLNRIDLSDITKLNINNIIQHGVNEEGKKEALQNNDKFLYKNHQYEQFADYVVNRIQVGKFDILKEELQSLVGLEDNDFKDTVGVSEIGENKNSVEKVNQLIQEAEKIKQIYDNLEEVYGNDVNKSGLDFMGAKVKQIAQLKNLDDRIKGLQYTVSKLTNGKISLPVINSKLDNQTEDEQLAEVQESFKNYEKQTKDFYNDNTISLDVKEKAKKYIKDNNVNEDYKNLNNRRLNMSEYFNEILKEKEEVDKKYEENKQAELNKKKQDEFFKNIKTYLDTTQDDVDGQINYISEKIKENKEFEKEGNKILELLNKKKEEQNVDLRSDLDVKKDVVEVVEPKPVEPTTPDFKLDKDYTKTDLTLDSLAEFIKNNPVNNDITKSAYAYNNKLQRAHNDIVQYKLEGIEDVTSLNYKLKLEGFLKNNVDQLSPSSPNLLKLFNGNPQKINKELRDKYTELFNKKFNKSDFTADTKTEDATQTNDVIVPESTGETSIYAHLSTQFIAEKGIYIPKGILSDRKKIIENLQTIKNLQIGDELFLSIDTTNELYEANKNNHLNIPIKITTKDNKLVGYLMGKMSASEDKKAIVSTHNGIKYETSIDESKINNWYDDFLDDSNIEIYDKLSAVFQEITQVDNIKDASDSLKLLLTDLVGDDIFNVGAYKHIKNILTYNTKEFDKAKIKENIFNWANQINGDNITTFKLREKFIDLKPTTIVKQVLSQKGTGTPLASPLGVFHSISSITGKQMIEVYETNQGVLKSVSSNKINTNFDPKYDKANQYFLVENLSGGESLARVYVNNVVDRSLGGNQHYKDILKYFRNKFAYIQNNLDTLTVKQGQEIADEFNEVVISKVEDGKNTKQFIGVFVNPLDQENKVLNTNIPFIFQGNEVNLSINKQGMYLSLVNGDEATQQLFAGNILKDEFALNTLDTILGKFQRNFRLDNGKLFHKGNYTDVVTGTPYTSYMEYALQTNLLITDLGAVKDDKGNVISNVLGNNNNQYGNITPIKIFIKDSIAQEKTEEQEKIIPEIKGRIAGQGTSIELEIKGKTGKEFLLVIDRNGKGNIDLYSEKKQFPDGVRFSQGDGRTASKEQVQKLYNEYVPKRTQIAINNWLNSFTGSWAAPETEDGINYTRIEKELNKELNFLENKQQKTDITSINNLKDLISVTGFNTYSELFNQFPNVGIKWNLDMEANASYDVKGNWINLSQHWMALQSDAQERLLLHELVHAYFENNITKEQYELVKDKSKKIENDILKFIKENENNVELTNDLKILNDLIIQIQTQTAKDGDSAYEELYTYALSNKTVALALSKIPSTTNTTQSVWSDILNIIKELLSLSGITTKLDEIVQVLNDIFEPDLSNDTEYLEWLEKRNQENIESELKALDDNLKTIGFEIRNENGRNGYQYLKHKTTNEILWLNGVDLINYSPRLNIIDQKGNNYVFSSRDSYDNTDETVLIFNPENLINTKYRVTYPADFNGNQYMINDIKLPLIVEQLYNGETLDEIFNNKSNDNSTGDNLLDNIELESSINEEDIQNQIQYQLKSINILQSDKAKEIFAKGEKNNWILDKMLTELAIPKEQKKLILEHEFDLYTGDTRESLILELASKYSYTIEINTAKIIRGKIDYKNDRYRGYHIKYASDNKKHNELINEGYIQAEVTDDGDVLYIKKKDNYEELINPVIATNTDYYSNLTVAGGTNYTENEISTPLITPLIKGHAQFSTDNGIGWFRSDETIGDLKEKYPLKFKSKNTTWEKRNNIWYSTDEYGELKRDDLSDDEVYAIFDNKYAEIFKNEYKAERYEPKTKTRRILEVQSDLFQKGRDKEDLVKKGDSLKNVRTDVSGSKFEYNGDNYEYFRDEEGQGYLKNNEFITEQEFNNIKNLKFGDFGKNENQFLQLLNKDNNWVTFFIKSIIQDSAKKGYEKVLFPSGNTASKVEGHSTLEDFKKEKESRLKSLEDTNEKIDKGTFNASLISSDPNYSKELYQQNNNEINQLKQELERVETEGFGALKPIYNFYENTVTNILNKQGYTPQLITDEYGNTWNEVELKDEYKSNILLSKINEIQYINNSGGAYGGDTYWDIIGREFGIINHKHYREESNSNLSKQLKDKNIKATILSKQELENARKEIKKILGISYSDTLQGNLQVRNYYQVANSDGIYAIAPLLNNKEVSGGTNTAIQLGIKLNKLVYVWDINTEKWYKFENNKFIESETPILTQNFTGIGSRNIENYNVLNKTTNKWESRKEYVGIEKENKAKEAIKNVYEKSLKNGYQIVQKQGQQDLFDSFEDNEPTKSNVISNKKSKLIKQNNNYDLSITDSLSTNSNFSEQEKNELTEITSNYLYQIFNVFNSLNSEEKAKYFTKGDYTKLESLYKNKIVITLNNLLNTSSFTDENRTIIRKLIEDLKSENSYIFNTAKDRLLATQGINLITGDIKFKGEKQIFDKDVSELNVSENAGFIIKQLINNIPLINRNIEFTLENIGTIQQSDYSKHSLSGLRQYLKSEQIVPYLQRTLYTSNNIDGMLAKLLKLAAFNPSLYVIYNKIMQQKQNDVHGELGNALFQVCKNTLISQIGSTVRNISDFVEIETVVTNNDVSDSVMILEEAIDNLKIKIANQDFIEEDGKITELYKRVKSDFDNIKVKYSTEYQNNKTEFLTKLSNLYNELGLVISVKELNQIIDDVHDTTSVTKTEIVNKHFKLIDKLLEYVNKRSVDSLGVTFYQLKENVTEPLSQYRITGNTLTSSNITGKAKNSVQKPSYLSNFFDDMKNHQKEMLNKIVDIHFNTPTHRYLGKNPKFIEMLDQKNNILSNWLGTTDFNHGMTQVLPDGNTIMNQEFIENFKLSVFNARKNLNTGEYDENQKITDVVNRLIHYMMPHKDSSNKKFTDYITTTNESKNNYVITAPRYDGNITVNREKGKITVDKNSPLYNAIRNIILQEFSETFTHIEAFYDVDKEGNHTPKIIEGEFMPDGSQKTKLQKYGFLNKHYVINKDGSYDYSKAKIFEFLNTHYVNSNGEQVFLHDEKGIKFNNFIYESTFDSHKIENYINKYINYQINKSLDYFAENKEYLYSLRDKSGHKLITDDNYEKLVVEHTLNYHVFNVEFKLFMGNQLREFKDLTAEPKRRNSNTKVGNQISDEYKSKILTITDVFTKSSDTGNQAINDFLKTFKSNDSIDSTDSVSIINRKRLEDYFKQQGRTPYFKDVLDAEKTDTINQSDNLLHIQKNFIYTINHNKVDNFYIDNSIQIKNSEYLLTEKDAKGTIGEKLLWLMDELEIDELCFKSAQKTGNRTDINLFDKNGDILISENEKGFYLDENLKSQMTDNIEVINNKDIRRQLDVTSHIKDELTKLGIQLNKKIFDNLAVNSDYNIAGIKLTGQQLFELHQDLNVVNVEEATAKIAEKLGFKYDVDTNSFVNKDEKKVYDYLYQSAKKSDGNYNLMYSYLYDENFSDIKIPIYSSHLIKDVMKKILSSVQKGVQVQKQRGSHVPLASTIVTKKLTKANEFSNNELGGIQWRKDKLDRVNAGEELKPQMRVTEINGVRTLVTECIIGRQYSKFFKKENGKIVSKVSIDKLHKKNPELLTMLGFRIPTEDKHSMVILDVIGFFDTYNPNQLIVADDFITQSGTDFDIDSLYTLNYELYKNKNIVKYDLSKTPKENTKAARKNMLVDIFKSILSNELHWKEIVTPNESKDLNDAADRIEKLTNTKNYILNPNDYLDSVTIQNSAFMVSSLKGNSIALSGACSIFQMLDTEISGSVAPIIEYTNQTANDLDIAQQYYKVLNVVKTGDLYSFVVQHKKIFSNDLNRYEDDKNYTKNIGGRLIGAVSSQRDSFVLDLVKNTPIANMNEFTLNMIGLFAITGVEHKGNAYSLAAAFINQPILVELNKLNSFRQSKLYNGQENINEIVEDIRKVWQDKLYQILYAEQFKDDNKNANSDLIKRYEEIKDLDIYDKSRITKNDYKLLGYSSDERYALNLETLENNIKNPKETKEFVLKQLQMLEEWVKLSKVNSDIISYITAFGTDKRQVKSVQHIDRLLNVIKLLQQSNVLETYTSDGTRKISLVEAVYPSYFKSKIQTKSKYPLLDAFLNNVFIFGKNIVQDYSIQDIPAIGNFLSNFQTEEDYGRAYRFANTMLINNMEYYNQVKQEINTLLGTEQSNVIDGDVDINTFSNLSVANQVRLLKNMHPELFNDFNVLGHITPQLSNFQIEKNGYHKLKFEYKDKFINDLTIAFEKGLQSENEFIKTTHQNLVKYNIYVHGLNSGIDSIEKAINKNFLRNDYDENNIQGIGYSSHLYNTVTALRAAKESNLDVNDMLLKYYQNNSTSLKAVSSLTIKKANEDDKSSYIIYKDLKSMIAKNDMFLNDETILKLSKSELRENKLSNEKLIKYIYKPAYVKVENYLLDNVKTKSQFKFFIKTGRIHNLISGVYTNIKSADNKYLKVKIKDITSKNPKGDDLTGSEIITEIQKLSNDEVISIYGIDKAMLMKTFDNSNVKYTLISFENTEKKTKLAPSKVNESEQLFVIDNREDKPFAFLYPISKLMGYEFNENSVLKQNNADKPISYYKDLIKQYYDKEEADIKELGAKILRGEAFVTQQQQISVSEQEQEDIANGTQTTLERNKILKQSYYIYKDSKDNSILKLTFNKSIDSKRKLYDIEIIADNKKGTELKKLRESNELKSVISEKDIQETIRKCKL